MPELAPPIPAEADVVQPHQLALHLRQAGAALGVAAVGFVGGFVVGDMLPTPVELGPHEATVRLIPESEIQIDAGPIGKASIDQHKTPFGGLAVKIGEIPDGDGAPLGAGEVRQYEQFFSRPGLATIESNVRSALLTRGFESGPIGAVGLELAYLLFGVRDKRRLRAVTMTALSLAVLTASTPPPEHAPAPENAALAAMGVHGVRIDGKVLETLVNKYGPMAVNYIKSLDVYYKSAEKNLLTAYNEQLEKEKLNPDGLSQMVADGSAEQVLWISDNHCNTEMSGITADMAKQAHVLFVADTGDQTMGGTAAERLCVAVLPSRLGKDIPIFVSLGNHDSRDITAQMDTELHYRVLSGGVVDYKGYRILGDSDVMRSEFTIPIRQVGPVSPEELGQRLAAKACADGNVTLVMAHEPAEGMPSAEQNCAKLVMDGHTHVLAGPQSFTTFDGRKVTFQMTNGTTGGAAPDKMTFESRLGRDATMVMLVFDKATKDPLGYRKMVIHPDGTAEVSGIIPFSYPAQPQEQGPQRPR